MPETDNENNERDERNILEKNDGNYILAAFAVVDRWPVPKALKSIIKFVVITCIIAAVAIMLSWPFWFHKMSY